MHRSMTRAVRRNGALAVLLVTAIAAIGCGGKTIPPPDLTQIKTMAIAPLIGSDAQFGMLTSRDLGNQMQIALKQNGSDLTLVFDQSRDLQPVTDAITGLKFKALEVYQDPSLAAKVAQALNVDALLIGRYSDTNIKTEEDDTPVFDMSNQAGISGTTKFTLIKQWATSKVWVKIVSSSGDVVWQSGTVPPKEPGDIQGYMRYVRAYQSQVPDKPPVETEIIVAHMRDHLWRRIAGEIYPQHFPVLTLPVFKEKPTQTFKTTGGVINFN